MTERLFVVAGTWDEFNHWCRERNISPRDRSVAYVRDWTVLQGQPRGMRYVVVGTGWDRRDRSMVFGALMGREAVEAGGAEIDEWRERWTRGGAS